MKRTLHTIISTSAASVLALGVLAQDAAIAKKDRSDYTRDPTAHSQRQDRLNGAAKASDLIGITVNNYQNEKLGTVDDLAVDLESGRILQVILSTGGFIGIGDSLTAVPPGALHHDVAHKVLHLDADKEKLSNAPRFEAAKWGECCDSNHLSAVYQHYGQEPALRFINKGDASLDGSRKKDGSPSSNVTGDLDGTLEKNRIANGSQSNIPEARLQQVQKASKLMGTSVQNLQGEKLGKVDNLILDLSSGRLVAVILSSGGFLGMNDELSAVPPTALRFTSDRETLQLDTSKELFSEAPHFKANQWPDFNQPGYSGEVYRAYKVEPYFTTDATADVDNTRRNARDRDGRTLTPLNQGNGKADLDTTAQIRKEIIAGKNMSVNAQNVKIITIDGRVTLRGPVTSAEEKRLIGEIANRIARSGNVDNQLEVKGTTSTY